MATNSPIKKSAGFSLIELIVAMAIIAIIASAVWGNFFSSLSKSRDSKRKQDIADVSKALELYYSDKKAYPTSMPVWGDPFVNDENSSVVYMQKLPTDPVSPKQDYCYTADSGGAYYKLYANLENTGDPNLLSAGADCNGVTYNYGISSANTTP